MPKSLPNYVDTSVYVCLFSAIYFERHILTPAFLCIISSFQSSTVHSFHSLFAISECFLKKLLNRYHDLCFLLTALFSEFISAYLAGCDLVVANNWCLSIEQYWCRWSWGKNIFYQTVFLCLIKKIPMKMRKWCNPQQIKNTLPRSFVCRWNLIKIHCC